MSVNRGELVKLVADESGLTKKDSLVAVSTVFDVITEALQKGEVVNITGFGRFTPKVRAARKGRNLQTGEVMDVGERTVVSFKSGKSLKDSLNA